MMNQSTNKWKGLEVLKGVYQIVMRPAVHVEARIAGCAKLLQVVLPLLLRV